MTISFVTSGCAFYGCAFFTADMTFEQVIEMVKNSDDPFWEGAEFGEPRHGCYVQAVGDPEPHGEEVIQVGPAFGMTFNELLASRGQKPESTNPTFRMYEFKGVPQPEPVLLFDSGHGEEDMKLLLRLKKLIG